MHLQRSLNNDAPYFLKYPYPATDWKYMTRRTIATGQHEADLPDAIVGTPDGEMTYLVRPKTTTPAPTPKAARPAKRKKTAMGKRSELNELLRRHGLKPKQVRAGAAELRKAEEMKKANLVPAEMRDALGEVKRLEQGVINGTVASYQLDQAKLRLGQLMLAEKYRQAGYRDPYGRD